ncbi:MAG: hypothetical protein QM493_01310 [Sulfurovum sp.]
MKKIVVIISILVSILNAEINPQEENFREVISEVMKKDFEIVFDPMLKMVYGVEYAKRMRIGLQNLYNNYYNQIDKIKTLVDRDKFEKEYQEDRDRFIKNHLQKVASIQYKINPHIKNNGIAKYNLPKPIVNQEIGIYTTIRAIFYLIPKRKIGEVVELLKTS